MSREWLTITVAALFTYLTRLSFIAMAGRWTPSKRLCRALQFVPVAVLCAIIAPEVLSPSGSLLPPFSNPRIPAAVVAVFIAWKWHSTLGAISVGMIVFWLLKL